MSQGLSPATIETIRSAVAGEAVRELDEATLRRLALGMAVPDGSAALLASPLLRRDLVRLRAQAAEAFGGALPSPEEASSLACLAVFAGPFTRGDVVEVFPVLAAFERLIERGWVEESEGSLCLPEAIRAVVPTPENGVWRDRFVSRMAVVRDRIDALLAEGRWRDGSAMLRERLPDLQNAWRLARELGRHDEVERSFRRLSHPLVEMRLDAFSDLVETAYLSAAATGNLAFRAGILSMHGAFAAFRDERARADALWKERLRIAEELGNHAAAADTLFDLAGQSMEERDWPTFDAYVAQGQEAAEAAGRPDLSATGWALRARQSLDLGELAEAHALAQHGLSVLTGSGGANMGIFVRTTVVRTLKALHRPGEAVAVLADVLERALEAGRAAQCATILDQLGDLAEWDGHPALAERCLAVCAALNGSIGTRRAESSAERLREFRARHPETPDSERPSDGSEAGWGEAVEGILERLWAWAPEEARV